MFDTKTENVIFIFFFKEHECRKYIQLHVNCKYLLTDFTTYIIIMHYKGVFFLMP